MKNLTKLINGAAKAARNTLKVDILTKQDYEDIAQAAALGSALGTAKKKNDKPYEFKAAKNEAMKHILSSIFAQGKTSSLHSGYYTEEETDISTLNVDETKLADMFLKTRKKKGRRGYNAACRDAKICNLILQGYGNVGIAQEMEISEHNIRRYRHEIRGRLAEIATKTQKPGN